MPNTDDRKIAEEYVADMNKLAGALDRIFNGEATGKDRKVCFTLLVAEFGQIDNGRVNYISNGHRPDIIEMLDQILGRFRAQAGEAENE